MSGIKFGFQTYTWQMSYEKYCGELGSLLGVIRRAGGAGVETEMCMLGPFRAAPERLVEALAAAELKLSALCYCADWRGPVETEQERADAQEALEYILHFPGTLLSLGQMPGADRENLAERQRNALACTNAVARRAVDRGVQCVFHPNSAPGSVFRVREDYIVLLEGLDPAVVGYAADTGHIVKGGMDPLAILREYRARLQHVHFKDYDAAGQWAEMGEGLTDFPAIVSFLAETGYAGWIMVEDESPRAEVDPDAVTLQNGRYIAETLVPLAGG
jgi:inosose dehydratase